MDKKTSKTPQMRHVKHPFPPVIDGDSEILILGSVPSVKSVEFDFYYMHPQNRFWKVMSAVIGENLSDMTVNERKAALIRYKIALYDAVEECDIGGSSDASISNVIPADIAALTAGTNIRTIFCNGQSSYKYFVKFHPEFERITVLLPSTSPTNASFGLDRLTSIWHDKINEIRLHY